MAITVRALVVLLSTVALIGAYPNLSEGSGSREFEYEDEGPYLRPHAVPVEDEYEGVDSDPEYVVRNATYLATGPSSISSETVGDDLWLEDLGEGLERWSTNVDDDATTIWPMGERRKQTAAEANSCSGHKKLLPQPTYVNASVNVIRKCCQSGEAFFHDKAKNEVRCRKDDAAGMLPSAITAQFYDGCIEDLEANVQLGVAYGHPCNFEGGLVPFGEHDNDTLYVIQNGSLLVIYSLIEDFDIFNGYCLDVNAENGSLSAYVCPSEVKRGKDIFKGQLVILTLCLMVAIPLLLATAVLYAVVPEFKDIHGKALSLNCVNFAIALLLETIFQHKSRGFGSSDETVVLENYAEYFILATFFWLLVNCANNCIHAWYFLPRGILIRTGGEKRTFAAYMAVAQLVPLAIILLFSNPDEPQAVKHYFFIPIIIVIVLNMISFVVSFIGLRRVEELMIDNFIILNRLRDVGRESEANFPDIRKESQEKVQSMTKYTALLFLVMASVWTSTIVTYYMTQQIPILFDISFGLQGILTFIIFICLPKPYSTVKRWFQLNEYCGCRIDPAEEARRQRSRPTSHRAANGMGSNGQTELVPLNNVGKT